MFSGTDKIQLSEGKKIMHLLYGWTKPSVQVTSSTYIQNQRQQDRWMFF